MTAGEGHDAGRACEPPHPYGIDCPSERGAPYDVEELFLEHHAALVQYLFRVGGDPDDAQDAAQEAFVKLMGATPPLSPPAWLYRVGKNVALDTLRMGVRHRRLLDAKPERAMGDALLTPEQRTEAVSVRDWVRTRLSRLSEKEQQILLMREEGYTHREIAQTLGGTDNSVAKAHSRAKMRLAVALGPGRPDDP